MAHNFGSSLNRRDFVQLVAASTLPIAQVQTPAAEAATVAAAATDEKVADGPGNSEWPVLTRYEGDHLRRIALPLGGIGTGIVSLGGRGNLRDWEIVNRPAEGYSPKYSFFTLYAKPAGGPSVTRALEGQIPEEEYQEAYLARIPNHGLPRFQRARFAAAYPFGQIQLEDAGVPLRVRIEAFNPLVPGDADASGLPVAILRFVLENPTRTDISASVCGSIENFIGTDGEHGKPKQNVNQFKKDGSIQGLLLESKGVPRNSEQWGTMALTAIAQQGVTYTSCWKKRSWSSELTDFWDDFSADGDLTDHADSSVDNPIGSLAVRTNVPAGETRQVTFLLAWHFPNRQTWTPVETATPTAATSPGTCDSADGTCCGRDPNYVGNYYTTRFANAWEAAAAVASKLPVLEEQTIAFVRSFCASDLPPVVKEAALYNVTSLRSQTAFRTEDGRFFGFEGCGGTWGCCHGSCTHVWNYEQATAFLFGDLSRSMREVEFGHATNPDGLMSFRVNLPIERAQSFGKAAADGQMGTLMRMYRDWQLSGDRQMLQTHWPRVKRALEFAWIKGGWDADQDGVMEGAQHNTMDVEYFGPSPQMQFWYLGALRSVEEMARFLGEDLFAKQCRKLFEQGRDWTDQHLFNGEYYEHEIRPPMNNTNIAPSLVVGMGTTDFANPDFQLGKGCLVDQLVGQFMAYVCGLGHLANPANIRTTLKSIMKYNFKTDLSSHFNNMRTFALGNEQGLLMATWPHGDRPKTPFPYYNEIMTGFEYAANIPMLYEGMTEEGLRSIEAIRKRYDGKKRNPFNEVECGSHYARAMASWGAVLALTGFQYSGVDCTMQFAAAERPLQWFWSNGSAWGVAKQQPGRDTIDVEITVLHGSLRLKKLVLKGYGTAELAETSAIGEKQSAKLTVGKQA